MIEADANLLTVGLPAIFWFHMNWGIYFRDIKKTMLTIINIFVLAIACAIVSHRLSGITISPLPLFFDLALFFFRSRANIFQCGLGLWVSAVAIHEDSSTRSWSCANNADS